jgi:hypothetical protein
MKYLRKSLAENPMTPSRERGRARITARPEPDDRFL